ncbi:MAG TPA: hypothetical protein VMF53_05735 [Alphaproteobacteria bacterium]|nr:hypothetical protein [Alphaproteobacteria bacterium]
MDDDRRIRFLISPMIFFASLVWGAWCDPVARCWLIDMAKNPSWTSIIGAVVAGGGILVFAFGYIFGTVLYALLRVGFLFRSIISRDMSRYHEVALSRSTLDGLAWALHLPNKLERSYELCAGVVFDHAILRAKQPGIHRWLFRRWNAFSVAGTSLVALVLSFFFGLALGISFTMTWLLPLAVFAITLLYVTCLAWCDTMKMMKFMITNDFSSLPTNSPTPP